MNTHDFRIVLRSDPALLCSLRGLVRTYAATLGFSHDRAGEVVLAVDEACTNAIRHSYNGDTGRELRLTLASDADWLELELCDEGVPAPAECVARHVPASPRRRGLKPGGLGVQLIHEVFDEVRYQPGAERGNRVTMRLRRPASGGPSEVRD